MSSDTQNDVRMAALSAISAYVLWGTFGLYFKALSVVGAVEILSHRIFWSVLLLACLISFSSKWNQVAAIFYNPRKLSFFIASSILIAINWGVYIYAVVSGQALEGSMGYFVMPLVAVFLGAIFFAERFSRVQALAIFLAMCGVVYQIWGLGTFPWIALTLALSFGFYGMLRKKAAADSAVGLFVETALIVPLAVGYAIYLALDNELVFLSAPISLQMLLVAAGPVTAIPLIMFAFGAKVLRYSTLGLLQYINPTCQFLVAVFVFQEPFVAENLITFAFIWAGLGLYSFSTLHQSRLRKSTIS